MSRAAIETPAGSPLAGMAREVANELHAPLSSMGGWLELLEERGQGDPGLLAMVAHMRSDLDRVERVGQRVERIGAEPRHEAVDLAVVVDRVADYYRARVPSLANTFVIAVEPTVGSPHVAGDAVLLEWAIELLVQRALDARAGRGGRITLSVARVKGGACRVRVADDGPGGAAAGSAAAGAGGVALAGQIVEVHRLGTLGVGLVDQGTAFDVMIE